MSKYSSEELQQMAKVVLSAKRDNIENHMIFVMTMCKRTNFSPRVIRQKIDNFSEGRSDD